MAVENTEIKGLQEDAFQIDNHHGSKYALQTRSFTAVINA